MMQDVNRSCDKGPMIRLASLGVERFFLFVSTTIYQAVPVVGKMKANGLPGDQTKTNRHI